MGFVVLGASKGIGFALTKKLLDEGKKVCAGILEDKPPEAMNTLSSAYGDKLLIGRADVTNESQVKSFAEKSAEFLGEIEGLCTVAGVIMPGDRTTPLYEVDVSELRTTFEVNVFGPIIAGKHFYPYMKKGGKILTITSESVGVRMAWAGIPCYALSKCAATKSTGIFNAYISDVDFYAVHPGRVWTDMNQSSGEIQPEESAAGLYAVMTGLTAVSRDNWYIDYKGNPMEM